MSVEFVKLRCVEVGECWEWASPLANVSRRRNPEVRVDGEQVSARRYLYLKARGEIRPGWVVSPNCGNPFCLNPAHQAQMTHKQRCQKSSKEGVLSGSKPKRTEARRIRGKLTMEKAREIRMRPEPGYVLAQEYGVDRSLIQRIRRGEKWKDQANPFAGLLAANDSKQRAA